MAVGVPFSGKSKAAEWYRNKGYQIIERDVLLEQILKDADFLKKVELENIKVSKSIPLTKDIEWNIKNFLASKELASRVVSIANHSEKSIFYDGTNLKTETRDPILKNLKDFERIEALIFDTPFETIIERMNTLKEKNGRTGFHAESFNENDLKKMIEWYQKPTKQEGFNEIVTYKPSNELAKELKVSMR